MGLCTTACRALLLLSAAVALTQATKPNFVYFLLDDLGFNDVSYHDDSILMPNVAQLSSEGMILENNYVAPVCSPSRSALMTGKLPWTIGEQHTLLKTKTPDCLTAEYPLIQESLRDLGYHTYMLGKWHEGYCRQNCTPRARGFEEFHGFYNSMISHFEHKIENGYDWRRNEDRDTETAGEYASTVLGNTAVEYMENHAAEHDDGPFYMYFSFPTVHAPLEAPADVIAQISNEKNSRRRLMKAMIKATDDVIGQVVDALKDNGMYENTVIIFSSDNGGQKYLSSNHPLRGVKSTIWEGGVRVPGFIHSPLMTASKGTVSYELFHQTDWYPTILSLAGGDLHDALDGFDQTDFLFHGGPSARDHVAIHYDQYDSPEFGRGAVRSGKWKLISGFPGGYNGYDSTGFWQTATKDCLLDCPSSSRRQKRGWGLKPFKEYAANLDGTYLLFDLEADPTETTDLSADHPDVVAELVVLLQSYADKAVAISEHATKVEPAADPELPDHHGFWSTGWC